jgi:hypothetical protein
LVHIKSKKKIDSEYKLKTIKLREMDLIFDDAKLFCDILKSFNGLVKTGIIMVDESGIYM